MKLTQSTVTIDHGIYGKSKKPALVKDGLAIVKIERRGASWGIYSQRSGLAIGAAGYRTTRAAATRVMAALLALPITWTGEEAGEQVEAHLDAVKAALATA